MARLVLSFWLVILLAFLPGGAATQLDLPLDHPKFQVASRVFDDLVLAIGDGRTRPTLRLLSVARRKVAWYLPVRNEIALEEQAYDLCTHLGPDSLDALAVLLSHELAHRYKDHGLVADFGNDFADLEVGKVVRELDQGLDKIIEKEFEADYFGGFYGYVAGYNTLGTAANIFERLYAAYDLDENPRYPSLVERQQIARRSQEKLRRMVPLFDAGNYLLYLQKGEEAARCFDHIARTFPSREILNNAGVARAQRAIRHFQPGELRFAYPFEMDAFSRLLGGKKAEIFQEEIGIDDQARTRLLQEAGELFEAARKKDRDYVPAYINLACIAELRGEYEDADYWARKAVKLARAKREDISLANGLIIRGIARAHSDSGAARQDFEAAHSGNPSLAQLNLAALEVQEEGTLLVSAPSAAAKPIEWPEHIASRAARDYDDILSGGETFRLPRNGPGKPAFTFYTLQGAAWKGLVIDTGYSTIALRSTGPGYRGETGKGIGIGADLAQIVSAYGSPAHQVSGRQGTYHVYTDGIIFWTNAAAKVQGWTLFSFED